MTATAALSGPVDRVLLDAVRAEQVAARAAEVRMLVGVVEWAVAHPPPTARQIPLLSLLQW